MHKRKYDFLLKIVDILRNNVLKCARWKMRWIVFYRVSLCKII